MMGKAFPLLRVDITPTPANDTDALDTFPVDLLKVEGLLGDIVAECARSAPQRNQPAYALAAAICCVGALAGRRYQSPTDLRTNIYALTLGKSSSGKGHPQKVIRQLLHKAKFGNFLSAQWKSGSGMQEEFRKWPVRLSIYDEVGDWLGGLSDRRTSRHIVEIKENMMKWFSAAGDIVEGNAYANTQEHPRYDLIQPHLCFLGATTPDAFFRSLQSGAMADGFIPRFLVFPPGKNMPERIKRPVVLEISDGMTQAARSIAGTQRMGNLVGLIPDNSYSVEPVLIPVPYDAAGQTEHDRQMDRVEAIVQADYAGWCSDALVGKWGEHAVKLALVRAISRDPESPVMDETCVRWGWRVADWCIRNINRMAERNMADNHLEREVKQVLNMIKDTGQAGITRGDISRRTRAIESKRVDSVLFALMSSKEIIVEAIEGGRGQPGKRYWASAE
jgi:hypothetical protein